MSIIFHHASPLSQKMSAARDRLLSSTFPLFSARTRHGKPPQTVPDKHTCTPLGTCELEIGPSRFPDTNVCEIIYTGNPASALLIPPSYDVSSVQYQPSSSSGNSSSFHITPAMLSQINTLASVNSRVAELLQLAHSDQATSEQLKELGGLVNSIVSSRSPPNPAEMVIEFRDRPGYRWIVPKEHAFWEARAPTSALVIKTVLRNSSRDPEPITLTLRNASPYILPFLERWVDQRDIDSRRRDWNVLVRRKIRI
jgi:hypothetical protein